MPFTLHFVAYLDLARDAGWLYQLFSEAIAIMHTSVLECTTVFAEPRIYWQNFLHQIIPIYTLVSSKA